MLKKIFLFLCCLLPWFLNNIIPLNYNYYKEIKLPFFAPPSYFYGIIWPIIYILIAISIYNIVSSLKWKEIPNNYKIILLINYIFNQSYTIIFFGLKNNFLAFISCLGTLITISTVVSLVFNSIIIKLNKIDTEIRTIFLKEETALMNNKISKILIPYILLSIFATILSLSIYLYNV